MYVSWLCFKMLCWIKGDSLEESFRPGGFRVPGSRVPCKCILERSRWKSYSCQTFCKNCFWETNSFLTSRHCPFGPPPVQCGLRYIPETKWQKWLQDMCEIKIPSSLQNCLQQELGAALNVPGVKQVLLSIRVLRPPKWQPRMGKPARARQCWLQAAFWNWIFFDMRISKIRDMVSYVSSWDGLHSLFFMKLRSSRPWESHAVVAMVK